MLSPHGYHFSLHSFLSFTLIKRYPTYVITTSHGYHFQPQRNPFKAPNLLLRQQLCYHTRHTTFNDHSFLISLEALHHLCYHHITPLSLDFYLSFQIKALHHITSHGYHFQHTSLSLTVIKARKYKIHLLTPSFTQTKPFLGSSTVHRCLTN